MSSEISERFPSSGQDGDGHYPEDETHDGRGPKGPGRPASTGNNVPSCAVAACGVACFVSARHGPQSGYSDVGSGCRGCMKRVFPPHVRQTRRNKSSEFMSQWVSARQQMGAPVGSDAVVLGKTEATDRSQALLKTDGRTEGQTERSERTTTAFNTSIVSVNNLLACAQSFSATACWIEI